MVGSRDEMRWVMKGGRQLWLPWRPPIVSSLAGESISTMHWRAGSIVSAVTVTLWQGLHIVQANLWTENVLCIKLLDHKNSCWHENSLGWCCLSGFPWNQDPPHGHRLLSCPSQTISELQWSSVVHHTDTVKPSNNFNGVQLCTLQSKSKGLLICVWD